VLGSSCISGVVGLITNAFLGLGGVSVSTFGFLSILCLPSLEGTAPNLRLSGCGGGGGEGDRDAGCRGGGGGGEAGTGELEREEVCPASDPIFLDSLICCCG